MLISIALHLLREGVPEAYGLQPAVSISVTAQRRWTAIFGCSLRGNAM
jgi:hypothetical protein